MKTVFLNLPSGWEKQCLKSSQWKVSGRIVSSLRSISNISFALLLCPLLYPVTWHVEAAILDKTSRPQVEQ